MDLYERIRTLPTQPGVYLYKNAEGTVIYVGKAINLRARVRSYLLESSQAAAYGEGHKNFLRDALHH